MKGYWSQDSCIRRVGRAGRSPTNLHTAAEARASGGAPKEGRIRGLGTSTQGPPGEQVGQGSGATARRPGLHVASGRGGALCGPSQDWGPEGAEMERPLCCGDEEWRRCDPRLWMPGVSLPKGPRGRPPESCLAWEQLSRPLPKEGESRAALGRPPLSSQGSMNRLLWPVNEPFSSTQGSPCSLPQGTGKTKLPREAQGCPGKHLDGELVRRAPREPPTGQAGPLLQPQGARFQ